MQHKLQVRADSAAVCAVGLEPVAPMVLWVLLHWKKAKDIILAEIHPCGGVRQSAAGLIHCSLAEATTVETPNV